ncbi:MAG: plastocyanin/azurin family copper-binding protein [Gemmatimonadota bacterium]|nr:plastocyanin/azurin family copper-binding protein [Gemmatimonadota bacterium]
MRSAISLISIIVATSSACSRSQPAITAPAAGSASVQASPQLTFSPGEAEIAVGGTVAWTFGSVAHNVTFQQGSGDAATYYGGQTSAAGAPDNIPTSQSTTVARTFSRAGSYHYRCTIHASMTGEVRVR